MLAKMTWVIRDSIRVSAKHSVDLQTARRLVGPNKIIGVSVNTIEQAKVAIEGGADYLGKIKPFLARLNHLNRHRGSLRHRNQKADISSLRY